MSLPQNPVHITSLVAGNPMIGANLPFDFPTYLVISGGTDKVWNIEARSAEEDIQAVVGMGNTISLSFMDNVWLLGPDNGRPPPRNEWILRPAPPPDVNAWLILRRSDEHAWTLNNSAPGTAVVLEPLGNDIPDSQKFYITSVDG